MIKINVKRIKIIIFLVIVAVLVSLLISFLFLLRSSESKADESDETPILIPPPETIMFPSYLFKETSLTGIKYNIDDEGNIILKDENSDSIYKITPQKEVYKTDKDGEFKLVNEKSETESVLNTIKNDKTLDSSLNRNENTTEESEENKENNEENLIAFLKQFTSDEKQNENKKLTISLSSQSENTSFENKSSQQDTTFSTLNSAEFLKSFATNNDYSLQNGQSEKEKFMTGIDNNSQSKGNKHTISKGVMIPITLITGINTDLPGIISAQINTNIYDSYTGENILIEKGTKVMGKYDSRISYSQNRVQTVWNSLITNKGDNISVPTLIGVDRNGQSGWSGKTDKHLTGTIVSSLASGLLNLGSAALRNNVGDTLMTLLSGVNNTFNTSATSFISRELNRQPTITIDKGQEAYLITTSPIVFEDNSVLSN